MSAANSQREPRQGPWEGRNYCWVVLCKNHSFHTQQNVLYHHRIILGETDAVSPPPAIKSQFPVRCDTCGREYLYEPSEVMRYETEPPEPFVPHALFQ